MSLQSSRFRDTGQMSKLRNSDLTLELAIGKNPRSCTCNVTLLQSHRVGGTLTIYGLQAVISKIQANFQTS